MNVLVYAGKEVLQPSLTHLLAFLQSNLSRTNAIQTINLQVLKSQPWSYNCAALILPRCQSRFPPETGEIIGRFIASGGSVLVFAAAARFGRTTGQSYGSFSFVDERARSSIELNLHDSTGNSQLEVRAQTADGAFVETTCYESSSLDGLESVPGANILARFEGSRSIAAGIQLPFGSGNLVVWCANLDIPSPNAPAQEEEKRVQLLRESLALLQLQTTESPNAALTIHPQFLTYITESSAAKTTIDGLLSPRLLTDSNDTFSFHSESQSFEVDEADDTKHIIVYAKDNFPSREQTPLFDPSLFFRHLSEDLRKEESAVDGDKSWRIGEVLLYGQVVTSTQTMLERNPQFHSILPSPLVSIASHQIQGRGRGTNVWVSPQGCLQMSILLRIPMTTLPSNKIVFVQYLFALAVVEACNDNSVLGARAAPHVRIKWPNDLYLSLGESENEKKKIGGILVNTSFSTNLIHLVIGCGLNVTSPPPLFSLSSLVPGTPLELECTAATILRKFNSMWDIFLEERGSFDSFLDLYLERWLHSDQLVTLTTTNPPTKVRICGITLDHGLLRTLPEDARTLSYIDLQPDGNSFDIMAGLIKSKT